MILRVTSVCEFPALSRIAAGGFSRSRGTGADLPSGAGERSLGTARAGTCDRRVGHHADQRGRAGGGAGRWAHGGGRRPLATVTRRRGGAAVL